MTEQDGADPWRHIQTIGEAERHFNDVESKYRALVSTWLLAAFAGMGFLAGTDGLPVPQEVAIFAIALAGSLGIQLLWVVDLLAYHRLLSAYYLEGLRIEARHPELPQVRWNMWRQGVVEARVKLFYAGCSTILLPFGLVAVVQETGLASGYALLAAALTGIPLAASVVLWRNTDNAWLRSEVAAIGADRQTGARDGMENQPPR